MPPPESSFWDFSLIRYARPGVPELCVGLQDRHGADVNLVLFCIWTAYQGWRFRDANQIQEMIGAVGDWHREVVVPLRKARRFMKTIRDGADDDKEDLRREIKKAELGAERLEQDMLHRFFIEEIEGKPECTSMDTPHEIAIANLEAYFAAIGAGRGKGLLEELGQLATHCLQRGLVPADQQHPNGL